MDKTVRDAVSSRYRGEARFWLRAAFVVALFCLMIIALALSGWSVFWLTPSIPVFALTVWDLINYWRSSRDDARNAAGPPPGAG